MFTVTAQFIGSVEDENMIQTSSLSHLGQVLGNFEIRPTKIQFRSLSAYQVLYTKSFSIPLSRRSLDPPCPRISISFPQLNRVPIELGVITSISGLASLGFGIESRMIDILRCVISYTCQCLALERDPLLHSYSYMYLDGVEGKWWFVRYECLSGLGSLCLL